LDTHGAHPNTGCLGRGRQNRISIRPFFTEAADSGPSMQAMKGVIASLKIEKKKRDSSETETDEWSGGLNRNS
jgi:hypothetical protein